MSTTTSNLNLELPGNGEYVDTWDFPLNQNFTKIDTWAGDIESEIQDARFGQATLKDFLQVSINSDGSLKPTEEVSKSRSSFTYGDETATGDNFDLASRLYQSDREVFDARDGYSDLRELNSIRSFKASMVLDGLKDSNGYPAWLGFTGANAQIDGDSTDLILMIGGAIGRVRGLSQVTISGAIGTKYIYAQYNPSGLIRVDGDSTTAPPASANGIIGSDGIKVRVLEDTTMDFTTQDVKPGDILEILGSGVNAGKYQIVEIAPNGNNNQVKIKGVFPGGTQAGLNYTITDPKAVTLGFDDTKSPSLTKMYIGEVDWDGSAILAVRALHFEDYFVGEWRSVNVSSSATFTEIWNHKLFDDALEVQVQVSQANDGSDYIETLSLSQISSSVSLTNTLGVAISGAPSLSGTVSNGTLAVSSGTLSGSVSNGTLAATSGTLSTSLTGSLALSSSIRDTHSAKARWNKTQVTVSNVTNNLFYKDYSGVERTTGFVRVVVKKLRK